MQIKPASEHVGAEITDVNLADSLSKGTFETIDGEKGVIAVSSK